MYYAFYNRLCVPVTASARTVIRAALRRLRKPSRRGRRQRGERHKLLRAVLKEHADAMRLYRAVATGAAGTTSRRRTQRASRTPAA